MRLTTLRTGLAAGVLFQKGCGDTSDSPPHPIILPAAPSDKVPCGGRLASIREYPELNDPKPVVANLIKALKQQNPQSQHAVIENPKTGEVVIDFVTWPADQWFVEFNVFKYGRRECGGLVAHQYALRDYKDPREFMRGLKPVRARLVKLMTEGGLRSPSDR